MRKMIALAVILGFCLESSAQAETGPPPVVFLGSFSNMRATEEHQYGVEVQLWRQGSDLFGFFFHAAGLSGDTPRGFLEEIQYDPQTGKLSFQAKLTVGRHYCEVHRGAPPRYWGVPSHDLFTFQGILTPASLSGDLQHFEALHLEKPLEAEKVVLHKIAWDYGRQTDYQSRSQWDREAQEILKFRGPKW